jgi:hypothetical protein
LLYYEAGDNARVRLAFLHDVPERQVPLRLRAWYQFRPFDNDDQLNQLIRWAADRLGLGNVEASTVHWPEPIDFRLNLADRLVEWSAIFELLAGRARERVLLFEAPSGLGKSALVRQAAEYARKLGVPVVRLDFKGGGSDVESILGEFELDLGQSLPNFSREGAIKTHLLRRDLRRLREPILVIFDTYEACVGNQTVVDWMSQQFLVEVETAPGLAVIIAGQTVPDYNKARWGDQARHFALKLITEIEHWKPWVEQNYPDFQKKGADLATVMMLAQGNPAVVSSAVEAIFRL